MLAQHMQILQAVIDKINSAITEGETPGVAITQVNVALPDGKSVTLFWNPEAVDNGDGTFTADWQVTAT